MRQVVIALLASTCLLPSLAAPARAQGGASVGFKNETPLPLIIQGHTLINGVQRRGAPLLLGVGRAAFDLNVPPEAIRFYTVFNGNQPAQILLRDFPIPIRSVETLIIVRPSPRNPNQVEFVPANSP
jgi:hypothetical protein